MLDQLVANSPTIRRLVEIYIHILKFNMINQGRDNPYAPSTFKLKLTIVVSYQYLTI